MIALEPILTFQMRGLGYLDPEWGHGMWKGDEAIDGVTSGRSPTSTRWIRATSTCSSSAAPAWATREGIGVLEQLVIGPHAPSGFTSILDPAR